MAFDVSWIFTAKNKYSKEAKKIAADTAKINKEAKAATGALLRKGSALRKLKAAAIIAKRKLRDYRKETTLTTRASSQLVTQLKTFAVTAVAGLGLLKIIQEGAKFQDSMADLSAITGAVGKDFDFLKGKVKELAISSRVLPTDVALAFKSVASAKPELLENTELLSKVTEKVLLLKNAAGIEMEEAVNTVARGLNIFGAEADQAGKFVDILAAGAKFGSSEIRNTGEALLIAGGSAVDAGLSFTELNAAIQVVAKGGFVASQAGTGLQAIFIKLTKAGFDFKKLGVDGVMSQVADMLDRTEGSAAKAQLKSKLFGEEHQKIAGALLRNIPLITELNEKLKTTGIATEQARVRMATFNSGVEGMKVKLSLLASGIFDKTLPAIGFLTGGVNSFLSSLDESDIELFSLLLTGLAAAAGAVGLAFAAAFKLILFVVKPVFAVLKGIATVVGQVTAAFATLDFSQFDLGGAFDLGGRFLGLGEASPSVSPAVSSASANATVSGEIVVRDSGGNVESVSSDGNFQGAQGNIGLGLAG